jgi:hypothetical protein
MASHKKNVIVIIAGLLTGLALLLFACWQQDLQLSPNEWQHQYMRELLPFWFMWNTKSYVMWYGFIFGGFFIAVVSCMLALWYWTD